MRNQKIPKTRQGVVGSPFFRTRTEPSSWFLISIGAKKKRLRDARKKIGNPKIQKNHLLDENQENFSVRCVQVEKWKKGCMYDHFGIFHGVSKTHSSWEG